MSKNMYTLGTKAICAECRSEIEWIAMNDGYRLWISKPAMTLGHDLKNRFEAHYPIVSTIKVSTL